MYETRKELIKKMHDICEDLNECEVALEHREREPDKKYIDKYMDEYFPVRLKNIQIAFKKELDEQNKRLDRLEEIICGIIAKIDEDRPDIKWLKAKAKAIYEEQAAAEGEDE